MNATTVVQNFFSASDSAPLVESDEPRDRDGRRQPDRRSRNRAGTTQSRLARRSSLVALRPDERAKELWKCGDILGEATVARVRSESMTTTTCCVLRHVIFLPPDRSVSTESVWGRSRTAPILLESVTRCVPVVKRGNRVLASDCYRSRATLFEITIETKSGLVPARFEKTPRATAAPNRCVVTVRPRFCKTGFCTDLQRNERHQDQLISECVEFRHRERLQWTALDVAARRASRIGRLLLVLKENRRLHIVRCHPWKIRRDRRSGHSGQASNPQQAAGEKKPFPAPSLSLLGGRRSIVDVAWSFVATNR